MPIWNILWLKHTHTLMVNPLFPKTRYNLDSMWLGKIYYYDLIPFHSVPYDDAFDLLVEALYAVPESGRCGFGDGDWDQDGFGHLRLRPPE